MLESESSALGGQGAESVKSMNSDIENDDMLDEYDFSDAVQGKYVSLLQKHGHMIMLAPDVAEVFPDSETVNSTLRGLIPAIKNQAEKVNHR
jgi:hypothetical protein